VPLAAFRFAQGGPRIDSPPPLMGANTEAVLGELGYGSDELAELRAGRVI
jgi:crotonobetainyl-CoA:carnitine CoA-transferase CaiB-like acyl-CoA transferase